jgi:hypothetical protein
VVLVNRVVDPWCGCANGFLWTITFVAARGDLQLLSVHDGKLTGDGAAASAVASLRKCPWLNGTFALAVKSTGGDRHYMVGFAWETGCHVW